MSTAAFTTLQSSGGTIPTETVRQGSAKAWANWNSLPTTAVIRDSFNTSSLADNGVGDITTSRTTALANSDYAVGGFCNFAGSAAIAGLLSYGSGYAPLVGSLRVGTSNCTSAAGADAAYASVIIVGDIA